MLQTNYTGNRTVEDSLWASAAGTVRVCPRWRAVDPIVACALVVGATRAVAIAAIGTVRLDASQ
jgi:hypothetical protein